MNEQLKVKVLKLAAQICKMHGDIAGDRICQDWSKETDVLDSLAPQERDELMFLYEKWNSNGADFEPGHFPYDEMLISFVIGYVLELLALEKERENGKNN
jgi:hypothetical protein